MKEFTLVIVSATETVYSGKAQYCGVTTLSGALGFEAFHEPFLGVLQADSEIHFTGDGGNERSLTVESGLISFENNNSCTVVGIFSSEKDKT